MFVNVSDCLFIRFFAEIKWQSPGYRSPTPTNAPVTPIKEEDVHTEEKTQFDFMDDLSSPKLPVRREGDSGLKGLDQLTPPVFLLFFFVGFLGSAKKKTTSLDGVLSNMRRHRRLELQMMDPAPSNNNS